MKIIKNKSKKITGVTNSKEWSRHISEVFFKYNYSEDDILQAFDTSFEELPKDMLKEILNFNVHCIYE